MYNVGGGGWRGGQSATEINSPGRLPNTPVNNETSARRRQTSAIGWPRRPSATCSRPDVGPMSARQRLGNGWPHGVGPTSGQMSAPQRLGSRCRADVGPTTACHRLGSCRRTDDEPMHENCCVANHKMFCLQQFFRQFNARYCICNVVSDKPAVEGNASVRLLTSCVLFSLCANS